MNQLTAQDLKDWISNEKDFLLIDIREDWEREAYNIGGVHIPMDMLVASANQLPKDKHIVLYCEKGIRTVITIQRLEASGFDNLYNLSGGMKAWKESL
jgi:rhodanese-related sulfurtransferase